MAAATLPFLTANSYAGLAVETTYGASVAPTLWTPITSPKVTPGVKWLDDSDLRGSPVMHYDQVQGVFNASYDFKTYTYSDVFPNFIRGALGSADVVASVANTSGTGGSFAASTHTIGLLNAPNQGSQSPSYTIVNDSVDNTYTLVASRLNTLSLSFQADAAVEATVAYKTNQAFTGASISGAPSPESTQHLIPAWNCAASIGGVASTVVESAQLDIKRNTNQIYTLGSQSAISNFQGPLEISGKMVFVCAAGITGSYWANALVRDQQQVLLNLIDPFTGYSILFQMSAVQLENPVIDQSKAYISLTTDLFAIANTTDAVSNGLSIGGYSPMKTVTTNGVASAY